VRRDPHHRRGAPEEGAEGEPHGHEQGVQGARLPGLATEGGQEGRQEGQPVLHGRDREHWAVPGAGGDPQGQDRSARPGAPGARAGGAGQGRGPQVQLPGQVRLEAAGAGRPAALLQGADHGRRGQDGAGARGQGARHPGR